MKNAIHKLDCMIVGACALADRYVIFHDKENSSYAREAISNCEYEIRKQKENLVYQLNILEYAQQRLNKAKLNIIKKEGWS